MCALFGVDEELAREGTTLESLLPGLVRRNRRSEEGGEVVKIVESVEKIEESVVAAV